MKEITPQVYTWSRYAPQRRRDRNGHFVRGAPGEPGVLIDPVAFGDGDEAHLDELGGVAAVLLTGAVEPEAAACAATLGCRILAPAPLAEPASAAQVEGLDAAAPLAAGLRAIPLPPDSGGGVAFYHRESGSLFAGAAALAGAPAGQVSLPAVRVENPAAAAGAARGLRGLLAVPAARLLVGEGTSLLHEPARALQDVLYRHDPAAFLLRPGELHEREPFVGGSRYHTRNADCARLLGLTAHDFDVSVVPPGCENFPLHRHDGSEELYVILEGEGEVRTEQGAFPFGTGDVLGFPPRYQIAHALRNTGAGDLRFLSFAAPAERLGMNDYPESGQRSETTSYGKRHRFFLPQRVDVGYWEGTPTE